jgi:hypothetical protein
MNARIAGALLLLVAVLAGALFITAPSAPQEPGLIFSYSSADAGPGGTLALRRWLGALGFETRTIQGNKFAVPEDLELLFVLGPIEPVTVEDARELKRWVEAGGTLVVASDRGVFDTELFGEFGAALESSDGSGAGISPALSRPPFADLRTGTARDLVLRDAAAVLIGREDRALVAVRRTGVGTVYLSSAPDMLANVNLGRAQNDRFVLNLLADVRDGAAIGFDEYHHGEHVPPDLTGLLVNTGPGRAFIFVAFAAFAFVALRGRRFGSPLPLEVRPGRSALDYIRSFAALLRRSRSRDLVAERLSRLYRRRLARALGLRAVAGPDEIVEVLQRAEPALAARVRALFASLSMSLRERDLLASVARAETLLNEIERR